MIRTAHASRDIFDFCKLRPLILTLINQKKKNYYILKWITYSYLQNLHILGINFCIYSYFDSKDLMEHIAEALTGSAV